MIENLLQARAEANLNRDFGWVRHSGTDAVALFPEVATEVLAEQGLDWLVYDFDDLARLNSLNVTKLDNGTFGCVYEIGDSDIVVKKYYPRVYFGGFKGENRMRRISNSSILRSLRVNLALERLFKDDPDYAVPKYLGHLMLKGGPENYRHYTLMSKLNIANRKQFSAAEKARDEQLIKEFAQRCMAALRMSEFRTMSVDLDVDSHSRNLPPVIDEATGRQQLGIIDQATLFKWRRIVNEPLLSYYTNDQLAPWLSTELGRLIVPTDEATQPA